ncbi:hypothetical protein JI749_13585 [Devosia oryziradicis]|uniref:Uncharacterized protein n=1 Tax=Devosia oryziradicis TaxID=2801335 RepID=A0ABX7BTU3_9HYPH|nr:hypothetical protein [Devosia oryziradicis]QQR35378.1 hypothetical protein JI749_13585 [Devosia oryziradicis]
MTTQTQTLPRLDPHLVYGVDAGVSAAMGIALLVMAEPLTRLAGWDMPAGFLWTIGLLLLPWAAFNAMVARMPRPGRAMIRANLTGDIAWIAGSIALIVLNASSLSSIGLALLVGQGVAVAGVLALKLAGARDMA